MQVRDIMTSPAITIGPEADIRSVARTLREQQVSGLPVVDADGQVIGLITELDLIARSAPIHEPHYIAVLSALIPVSRDEYREYKEQLRHALAINASQLMTEEFATVAPETAVEEALELMLDPEITLLPVMSDGKLAGVVTHTHLVRLIESLESAPEDEGESDTPANIG
jgi:CBS domain-containing protein